MQAIADNIVSFVLGILITFFLTSIATRKAIAELAKETVRAAVVEHLSTCPMGSKIAKMERALLYLVVKNGGNPSDMGLL